MRSSSLALALVSLGVVSLATTTPAYADDAEALRRASHAWFDGERQSGFLWGGVGLASLGSATALYRFGHGSDVERGMAIPVGAFGLLQTFIGVASLSRGDARASELDARIAQSPQAARDAEVARMRTWGLGFLGIQIVEGAVLVGAAAYAATRTHEDQARSRGVGLGLAMEGGAMLFLDSIAAARASGYAGQLDTIHFSVGPAASGHGVSLRAVF